jgi:hypothetical protein
MTLVRSGDVLAARLARHQALVDGTAQRALAFAATGTATDAPPLPDYVVQAVARLRLLIGVPFGYLVPSPDLLPVESARFFVLDPAWLDQLCVGALAVGAAGTREQAQSELALAPVQQALGRHLALVRDLERGRAVLETALADSTDDIDPAAAVSGVLIHSALVSGWPGLQVRAYTTDDTTKVPLDADPSTIDPALSVRVLRMDRLDPSILIVLFAGVPKLIWLEEPHHGVQFGVDEVIDGSGQVSGYTVPIRHPDGTEHGSVQVPFRAGAADVVDVATLAGRLDAAAPLGRPRASAAMALALLAPPVRQRFNASTPGGTR